MGSAGADMAASKQKKMARTAVRRERSVWPAFRYGLMSLLASAVLVFSIELIFRGDFASTVGFFLQPFKPGWTTIILFTLILIALDALLGRAYQGLMLAAPLTLALAFIGHQKSHYLGDPLYPTDFLFARQIVELLPLLVRERPMTEHTQDTAENLGSMNYWPDDVRSQVLKIVGKSRELGMERMRTTRHVPTGAEAFAV